MSLWRKFYRWCVGHPNRYNYWSCSKFAQDIRSMFCPEYQKPAALEMHEWKIYKTEYRKAHSFVFWFLEDFLDDVQDIVNFPMDIYHNVRCYIRNRFIDKTHYMPTGLKPGQWYDVSTRMLNGPMETLRWFVEVEKANCLIGWAKKEEREQYKLLSPRERGLKHLEWEMTLTEDSPYQAKSAGVIREVYLWWVDVYPYRKDPMDLGGWSEFYNKVGGWDKKCPPELEDEQRNALDETHKIEVSYTEEETEMLKKLIEVRNHLWT